MAKDQIVNADPVQRGIVAGSLESQARNNQTLASIPVSIPISVPNADVARSVRPALNVSTFAVSNGGDSINLNGTSSVGFGNLFSPTEIVTNAQTINIGTKAAVGGETVPDRIATPPPLPIPVNFGGDSINTIVGMDGSTATGFGNPLTPITDATINAPAGQLISTGSKNSIAVPVPGPPIDNTPVIVVEKSSRLETETPTSLITKSSLPSSTSAGNSRQSSVGGSFHENFFYSLGKWATGVPMQHLWVIVIDFRKIQNSINYWLASNATEMTPFNSPEQEMYASLTSTEYQNKAFEQYSYGCLFARSINVPGEKIETTRAGIEGMAGGMLFPSIIANRSPLPEIGVSFMETNASFVDFVIRPWLVATSHAGTVARVSNSLKTNMTAYFYSKSDTLSDNRAEANTSSLILDGRAVNTQFYSPGAPFILNGQPLNARKIFTFEDILPVSVNAQEYTQSGEGLQIRPCNFTYTKYYTTSNSSSSNLLTTLPTPLTVI